MNEQLNKLNDKLSWLFDQIQTLIDRGDIKQAQELTIHAVDLMKIHHNKLNK
jgi:hypothetical protein